MITTMMAMELWIFYATLIKDKIQSSYLLFNIRFQADIFYTFEYQLICMENCLECGEKIIGRSDKKFCNDGCRNAYNNQHNKDSSNFMRNVNNKLRKNHRILNEQPYREGKAKTTRNKLFSEGFDFDYFTNRKVYKNGAEYRFVYDIGYKLLEDDWILLVKKE